MQTGFFLTRWLFLAMRWLYESVTNESIVLTVIIATIFIRLVTVVGDIKSRESSMKMAAIQPQLDKIRKKYEKDPNKLNMEQRKVMKENNVSMMGGCLPMLFTLPLFFMFIAAFRQWGTEMMVKLILLMDSDPAAGLEFFENFKFLWINNMWAADNGFKPVIAPLRDFLVNAKNLPSYLFFRDNPGALDAMVRLGFLIPDAAEKSGYALAAVSDALTNTYDTLLAPCAEVYAGRNNGWFILPVVGAGTTFLSSWLMMRKQPKTDAAANSNKLMQYLMPAMTLWVCLSSNSAFALYWTTSNVLSMGTSLIINRIFEKKYGKPTTVEVKKA